MPDELAERVRTALAGRAFTEKRMFGGVAFMLDGKMIASASKRGLLVRVGKEGQAAALKDPQAKLPVMGPGRPMSGYVRVAEAGLTDAALARWLDKGMAVVGAMGGKTGSPPPRPGRSKQKGASRRGTASR